MKIKELFTDETKWTQGALARTKKGNIIGALEDNAVCWCLQGAVLKCYGSDRLTIIDLILDKVDKHCIALWNDAHTFTEVKELVERLDI